MSRRLLAGLVVVAIALAGCSDDDDDAAPPEPDPGTVTVTSQEPATGGLDIPDLPGTYPAPLPSIGFGIAVPEGWQATVLTPDALERLEGAALAEPSFFEAAETVAASGAVFYAAGSDDEGRVGELKIDVQDDADTSAAAVAALAASVAESGEVDDAVVVDDLEGGRVRVDYRIPAPPEGHGGEAIETFGSQLFVPDGDRLWSVIVTSEDQQSQDALLTIFATSFTL